MYKYKNVSDRPVTLVGLGSVPAGQEFSSRRLIENPKIKLIGKDDTGIVGTATAAPNAVTEASRVEDQTINKEAN